jgi:Uma2 family endonuclease
VPFYALGDGATVRIHAHASYEPDALVAPLPKPPPAALEVANPVIVVEVLSPSGEKRDLEEKVGGYAQVPSIAHYLVIDPMAEIIWHHTRTTLLAGAEARRATEPVLRLDPPGIEIRVAEVFAP